MVRPDLETEDGDRPKAMTIDFRPKIGLRDMVEMTSGTPKAGRIITYRPGARVEPERGLVEDGIAPDGRVEKPGTDVLDRGTAS